MCLPGPLSFGEEPWPSRKAFAYSWGASLTAHVLVIEAVMLVPRVLPPLSQPEVVTWQVVLVDSDHSENGGLAQTDQSPKADATTHISAQLASESPDFPSPMILTSPPSFLSGLVENKPVVVEQSLRTVPAERRVAMTDEVQQPEVIREAAGSTVSATSESEPAVVAKPVTAESSAEDQAISPAPSAAVSEPMVSAISTIPESERSEVTASLHSTSVEQSFATPDLVRHDARAIEEIQDRASVPRRVGSPESGSEDQQQVANLASEPSRPLGDSTEGSAALGVSSKTRNVDYGWLVKSIRGRILDLKQYPVEARLNRYEGRVIVRAVISEAGELLDVSVVQSSGHEVLDRDAIDLLRRVCPIMMREPLQRQAVAVKVPVSYSLRN